MRYRLMATYLGVPYHAGLGPDGNEATLFSPAPPPDELGFTAGGGHWRKQVSVTDLDALWQSRLVGEYRGEPCLILDDLGDRLHIAYLGRDSTRARQLGYWEIDREVFEVVVARPEVAGLTEERVEYPLTSAMFPPSNRDPVPAAALPRPEGPGRGAPAPHAAGGAPPSASERTSPLRAVPRTGPMPAAADACRGAGAICRGRSRLERAGPGRGLAWLARGRALAADGPGVRAAGRAAGPGAPVGLCRTPQPGRHPARGVRGRRGGAGRHVPGQGGRRLRGVQPYR